MFNWFKKRITKERYKLIFQNAAATQRFKLYFEQIGRHEEATIAEAYEEETNRIAKLFYNDAPLTNDDLQMLLDINRQVRRFFDDYLVNGSEAKIRQAFGQPPSQEKFDDVFKPILGWDNV